MKTQQKDSTRMTHAQFFKVCQELQAQENRMKQERPSYRKIVKEFSTKLGFSISTSSFRDARRTTNIDWTPVVVLKGRHSGGVKTRSENRRILTQLLNSVRVLTDEVAGIHIGLGNDVPANITTISNRLNTLAQEINQQHG